MGIYSLKNNYSADILTEGLEYVSECSSDDFMTESYNNILESEENYNRLMQMVGVAELAAYESTGEVLYEASDVGGFVSKVKEFFKKIWEKIQGIFKKFFALVSSFTKSNKDFVNKYKKDILMGSLKGLEFKGYKFTINTDAVKEANTRLENKIASVDTDLDDSGSIKALEDRDDFMEELRGLGVSSKAGKLDANEFRKELFELFRNGESSKEVLEDTDIDVNGLISNLISEAEITKKAKRAYNTMKKTIDEEIKGFERSSKNELKKVTGKDSDSDAATKQMKTLNDKLVMSRAKISILEAVNGAMLTAIRDEARQAKSICVKLIGRKPKNESFMMENGFLNGVTFK